MDVPRTPRRAVSVQAWMCRARRVRLHETCRDEQIEFETDLLRAMRADADRYVDERSDDEY